MVASFAPLLVALLPLAGAAAGAAAARAAVDRNPLLLAPPMAGRATTSSIELSLLTGASPVSVTLWLIPAIGRGGEPAPVERAVAFGALESLATPIARQRARGALADDASAAPAALRLPANALAELEIAALPAGTAYRWRLDVAEDDAGERSGAALRRTGFDGRFVTARPRGESFTFTVFSDTHVFPARIEPELLPVVDENEQFLRYVLDSIGWYRTTREVVASQFLGVFAQMQDETPDFAVSLGDVFDLHGRGFNWAFDSQELADAAHLEARRALGALENAGAIYQVLGNWEGESGCHPPEQRALARRARMKHTVNPRPGGSRFEGSPDEDYFAWEWGDALLIGLNVRGYTPTAHHLGDAGHAEGKPDDFTLGKEQKAFLEKTLAASDQRWKLLFMHHVVGGHGGNPDDSAYGRGGGRAARVGEQSWVHDLCVKHGAKAIFYGHDHVFTDIAVDGVHYALCGTTSAPWRFTTAETGYQEYWTEVGYARVRVDPASLRVEFVTLGGAIVHAFEVAAPSK